MIERDEQIENFTIYWRDGKAIEMSFDHKPEDTPERNRIETAGGRVTPDGRVNGGLNLSRAIGDHAYKTNKALSLQGKLNQLLICSAEIYLPKISNLAAWSFENGWEALRNLLWKAMILLRISKVYGREFEFNSTAPPN